MYLGSRRVRSAGRTSGSVEITLPAELHMLEGVRCRLIVRDGSGPEIVLQPNLAAAHSLFNDLWQKVRLGLASVDDIGDFSPADFTLALFPPRHWEERPPLAYVDALYVLGQWVDDGTRVQEALSRLLAFLGVAAGYRLSLAGAFAHAFGDALAYHITGSAAGLGTDFERGMAHRLFWGEGNSPQHMESPMSDQVWIQARPGLHRVYDQFRAWQVDSKAHASAREKWYRALTVELGGWPAALKPEVTLQA
jgi:hypothetical protein